MPHSFTLRHISSHQDEHKSFEDLTPDERNNTRCDTEAKKISSQHISQELQNSLPPGHVTALATSQGLVLENIFFYLPRLCAIPSETHLHTPLVHRMGS